MRGILVINAGSSSIKVAAFDRDMALRISATLSEIGGRSFLKFGDQGRAVTAPDHEAALFEIFSAMAARGFDPIKMAAAGHRVVHGGTSLSKPSLLNSEIVSRIEACIPLAPLHNPHSLAAIRALAKLTPGMPQVACFDTGFHSTNPEVARRYAIPATEDAKGIRRYGFHGISYQSLVDRMPGLSGQPLPRRLLAMHLGNGASLCAIRDGVSLATTMGYSPLDGLTMGTRSGGIDANAVLRLAADHGVDGAARILNRESGLLALSGLSDMRSLSQSREPQARFAVEHFCYWVVRHAGSMIAAMGGLDAIAFTGGIGENDPHIRAAILTGLRWTGIEVDEPANRQGAVRLHEDGSKVSVWTIAAAEELQIAKAVRTCLGDI